MSNTATAFPPSEDLSQDWVVDCNDAADGEEPVWLTACETWFTPDSPESDAEADKHERQMTKEKRIEEIIMEPRPFAEVFDRFKTLRPDQEEWPAYRFRNVKTGDILLAWLLKS